MGRFRQGHRIGDQVDCDRGVAVTYAEARERLLRLQYGGLEPGLIEASSHLHDDIAQLTASLPKQVQVPRSPVGSVKARERRPAAEGPRRVDAREHHQESLLKVRQLT